MRRRKNPKRATLEATSVAFTPEMREAKKAKVLEKIRAGASGRDAALSADLSFTTIANWRRKDPDSFGRQYDAAVAQSGVTPQSWANRPRRA
jgi:hypothetical protein